jgi:acetoin utilization protein AcuC
MPDGTPTQFGIRRRNLEAELAAMQAGLAPGQIRRGLRLLGSAIPSFENFMTLLGHDMYYIEPLYYHNAVLFERYGFSYQMGRKLMNEIHAGFGEGGVLRQKLDESTRFRSAGAPNSIRLRSWAIHDGILGEPFTNVTMYKRIGVASTLNSAPGIPW